jgi:hypothetical protein
MTTFYSTCGVIPPEKLPTPPFTTLLEPLRT